MELSRAQVTTLATMICNDGEMNDCRGQRGFYCNSVKPLIRNGLIERVYCPGGPDHDITHGGLAGFTCDIDGKDYFQRVRITEAGRAAFKASLGLEETEEAGSADKTEDLPASVPPGTMAPTSRNQRKDTPMARKSILVGTVVTCEGDRTSITASVNGRPDVVITALVRDFSRVWSINTSTGYNASIRFDCVGYVTALDVVPKVVEFLERLGASYIPARSKAPKLVTLKSDERSDRHYHNPYVACPEWPVHRWDLRRI